MKTYCFSRFYVVGARNTAQSGSTCLSGYEYLDVTPCANATVDYTTYDPATNVDDSGPVTGVTLYQDQANTQMILFDASGSSTVKFTCLGDCQGLEAGGLNPVGLTSQGIDAVDLGPSGCF